MMTNAVRVGAALTARRVQHARASERRIHGCATGLGMGTRNSKRPMAENADCHPVRDSAPATLPALPPAPYFEGTSS